MSSGVGCRHSSDVAVAVVLAGNYSSNSTPSLGISICQECGPKKAKKKREREDVGVIPASISGLRIQYFRELWCRAQTRLRFGVAVAVA